jgi:hypothetical protein
MLAVAAACWLAAGPGGIVVKAALACSQASMLAHHGHMGHGARTPSEGPCFCSQMVSAFDQAVSIAMPPLMMLAAATVNPIVTVGASSLFSLPPSPVVVPETPPPIVA